MKRFLSGFAFACGLVAMLGCMTGCGYRARNNEVIGQVKKIVHNTPLICPEYDDVDVSLGVMRNGVGSMSTQDQYFAVNDKNLLEKFVKAAETGQLVRIKYDSKRLYFCHDENSIVTDVEIVK